MAKMIHHTGVVLSTEGDIAHVEIVQTSACVACEARKMCMSSESQKKVVDAVMESPMKPGESVEVSVHERLAWRAVVIGYVLPFVVVMVVIGLLSGLTEWDDAIIGGAALGGLAIYYIVLGGFRSRLQKEFRFSARRRGS